MIETLAITLKISLPVFAYLILGILIKQTKLVPTLLWKYLGQSVYFLFIPILLFTSLYTANLSQAFNPQLLIFGITGMLALILLSMRIIKVLNLPLPQRPVIVQAVYRSNITMIALPVLMRMYPSDEVAQLSIFVVLMVPFFNLAAILLYKIYRKDPLKPLSIVLDVLKNPLIIGSILGILLNLLQLELPINLNIVVQLLRSLANPIALISVGASLAFQSLLKHKKLLLNLSLVRLLLVPALFFLFGYLCGFRHSELVAILLVFGAPLPTAVYQMSIIYNADHELSAQTILIHVLGSMLTIPFWIFILLSLNLT